MGFFQKIKETFVGKSTKQNEKYVAGLDKSSASFSSKINALAARYREINDEYFDELENILIMSDVGVNMVMKIVDEIKKEVAARDEADMTREISPLKKADDAIEIDTSDMTIDEVVAHIMNLVEKKTQ